MRQKITLPREARLFRKSAEWDGMYESGRAPLPQGTVISLDPSKKARLSWKGFTHTTVEVSISGVCGDNYYVIVEEAGLQKYVP